MLCGDEQDAVLCTSVSPSIEPELATGSTPSVTFSCTSPVTNVKHGSGLRVIKHLTAPHSKSSLKWVSRHPTKCPRRHVLRPAVAVPDKASLFPSQPGTRVPHLRTLRWGCPALHLRDSG